MDWKLRRIAAGFRQQDLAARLGISTSRYSALERGDALPRDCEQEEIEKLLPPLPSNSGGGVEVQAAPSAGGRRGH